jgi:hypothetical protein
MTGTLGPQAPAVQEGTSRGAVATGSLAGLLRHPVAAHPANRAVVGDGHGHLRRARGALRPGGQWPGGARTRGR